MSYCACVWNEFVKLVNYFLSSLRVSLLFSYSVVGNIYCAVVTSGTVLDAWVTVVNKVSNLCSSEAYLLGSNKQIRKISIMNYKQRINTEWYSDWDDWNWTGKKWLIRGHLSWCLNSKSQPYKDQRIYSLSRSDSPKVEMSLNIQKQKGGQWAWIIVFVLVRHEVCGARKGWCRK